MTNPQEARLTLKRKTTKRRVVGGIFDRIQAQNARESKRAEIDAERIPILPTPPIGRRVKKKTK